MMNDVTHEKVDKDCEDKQDIGNAKITGNALTKLNGSRKTTKDTKSLHENNYGESQFSNRRSTRRRTQPGRYVATIDHLEQKRKTQTIESKSQKRKKSPTKSNSNNKKAKSLESSNDNKPNTPVIVSTPGVWTKENNSFISSLCRRPIPAPFHSTKTCPNAIESVQLGTGTVTAWCPSIDRTPDLYRTEYNPPHEYYNEDITYDELMLGIANEKKRVATSLTSSELEVEKETIKLYNSNLRKKALSELHNKAQQLLPELCIVGLWELTREEEWRKKYAQHLATQEGETNVYLTQIKLPRYYGTRNPGAYFKDTHSKQNAGGNGNEPNQSLFGLTKINQRVKLGCNLAYEYCRRKKEKELGLGNRRTTRISLQKDDTLSKPSEYEQGGRVANFICHRLGFPSNDEPEAEEKNVGSYYIYNSKVKVDDFFYPPRLSILEYLAKNGSGFDMQDIIVNLLKEKKVINVMEKKDTNVELVCATGDTIKKLKEYDHYELGKCRFSIRNVVPIHATSESTKDMPKNEQSEELKKDTESGTPRPINSDTQKKFEVKRYISIHSGYTIWPSWTDCITKLLSTFKQPKSLEEKIEDDIRKDEDFAASLSSTTSRRSKRATQSDSTNLVFYGAGVSITRNQLIESIHRLIMQAYPGFVTSLSLCRLVCDGVDHSDWRKIRLALGKLLCREGRIERIFASTSKTDYSSYNYLSKDEKSTLLDYVIDEDILPIEKNTQEEAKDNAKVSTNSHESNKSAHVNELIRYIRQLHLTELYIRSAIVNCAHLQVDVNSVAASADEDAAIDEIENGKEIKWETAGHELLDDTIIRPGGGRWKIKQYLPAEMTEDENTSSDTLKKSAGKVVKRRARFQIVPNDGGEENEMVVTEAQVRAGKAAFGLWQQQQSSISSIKSTSQTFTIRLGSRVSISLYSDCSDEGVTDTDGCGFMVSTVVGFGENEENKTCILLLPDNKNENFPNKDFDNEKEILNTSFWGTLDGTTIYFQNSASQTVKATMILQDFEKGSPAYTACESVLSDIKSHAKASVFLEPVDPKELGINDYFDVIKEPMDLGTVERKLTSGTYSNKIIRATVKGQTGSPVKTLIEDDFKRDMILTFDNAIKYNPKGTWVHNAALLLKRNTIKKIETIVKQAEPEEEMLGMRQRKVYVDESDSDIDEAYLESEDDEEDYGVYLTKKRSRKHKKQSKSKKSATQSTEHNSTMQAIDAIEVPQTVPAFSTNSSELKNNCFTSAIKINSDVSTFSLPLNWLCRHGSDESSTQKEKAQCINDTNQQQSLNEEIVMMMGSRVRRSYRGTNESSISEKKGSHKEKSDLFEGDFHFFLKDSCFIDNSFAQKERINSETYQSNISPSSLTASHRREVEEINEELHEAYYAKIFHQTASYWKASEFSDKNSLAGSFFDSSFPPYLGRIYQGTWEIRTPYIAPALRWIIRGLIQSGHLGEMDPLTEYPAISANACAAVAPLFEPKSGVVSISNAYFWNHNLCPLDVVESKKQKVKSKQEIIEEEERKKDEQRVLSEYEQDRARRIARNQERLRALGLG